MCVCAAVRLSRDEPDFTSLIVTIAGGDWGLRREGGIVREFVSCDSAVMAVKSCRIFGTCGSSSWDELSHMIPPLSECRAVTQHLETIYSRPLSYAVSLFSYPSPHSPSLPTPGVTKD